MGIWDRLGNVIKSYISDDSGKVFKNSSKGDPDLDAAYEELDDFLRGNDTKAKSREWDGEKESAKKNSERKRPVPEEIRQDFAELGLTPEATVGECKDAYKKLLKIHHPDRHVKHQENMKKATDKAARVNAAYERLVIWFRTRPPVL
jgi:DnaJ-domain-containing protein 1